MENSLFEVDWDRLNARDRENLYLELLVQMGFKKVDWAKDLPGVDLTAELAKKDPDGFDYHEVWLISIHNYSLNTYYKLKEQYRLNNSNIPPILLITSLQLGLLSEYSLSNDMQPHMRVRVWHANDLTALLRQFPTIGYKYFSDEGRIASKTRKSYEALYRENAELLKRQTVLIEKLEDEKNKRVRAERDSVWKEISFSAAHKMGNPLFAIEGAMDPLLKRIREQRTEEAVAVVGTIGKSVEKAKAFIEQFKSLSKAQEIHPTAILLKPMLEDACRLIYKQDVCYAVDCPNDLKIQGDPEKVAECLDELAINATHWFKEGEKRVWFEVVIPDSNRLPDFLDSSQTYALIHVRDNGCGIPLDEKDRIFDVGFTRRTQGTGFGLAFVRRVIDGHGGGIMETGSPGAGADFELFFPLSEEK